MSSVQYLIGKSLGKYDILEHIGHGGMSEVYKGQQAQLNRMVAVKVLHPFLADEEGFVARFQREARIVATLRHSNIVQVYDFDYHDDLAIYYMVMEYIEGPTLKTLLEDAPLSAEDTIRVGIAIADALDYAHQRSMVHRDIKPANIMFLEAMEPVLTDFGIARMLALSGLTASGAMVGTPAYMAPEIGTGSAGTASSDIYSLSVVLYQSATGNLPFMAETPMGMVMDHINKTPPRPSMFAPDLPEALEHVILKGMEKDPEARFRTAGEMASVLRSILNPEQVPAPVLSLSSSNGATSTPQQAAPLAGSTVERVNRREAAINANPPIDLDDRLVKFWSSPSVLATPPIPEQTPPLSALPPRRSFQKLVRAPVTWLVLIAGVLVGSGIWFRLDRNIASLAWGLGTGEIAGAVSNVVTPVVEPATPTIAPTPVPALIATDSSPTPLPSPTPVSSPTATPKCALRVRLDQVNIEPSSRIAPLGSLMAYLTLRNNGTCAWPLGSELRLAGDSRLSVPERLSIKPLAPGEIVQILFPLTAPEELGSYSAELEMRDVAGDRFGSPVKVEIIVEDVPPLTSTPVPPVTLQIKTPQPLVVKTATLVRWEDQPDHDRWTGIVELGAEGGSGTYRYYQDEVSASTEIADGRLTVVGKRCEPVILTLWVLSGDQNQTWKETIPFPAVDGCR